MSSPFPSESPTFGKLHVGDTADDDGAVIDSFLVETDAPPATEELIGPIDPAPLHRPEPTTRLISKNYIVNSGWVPFQAVIADAGRVQLRLRVMSTGVAGTTTFEDYIRVGYDPGVLEARLWTGNALDLDDHTGDLWIGPGPALTAAIAVSIVAVTKGNR